VLILGASGGVGSLALEFAKLRGARVLATASGEDGLNFVKQLGADAVVDSRTGDIAAAARAFAPNGIEAILAMTGGDVLEHCIDTLRKGGRVAYPNGVNPPKPRPGVPMTGYDATPGAQEFERLNKAIDEAHPHITIAAEYPLANAAQAQERMEAGHVLGKIVLRTHP
jgi:NADPH:quinone reductase-like Zn-dependent oxidoreductase